MADEHQDKVPHPESLVVSEPLPDPVGALDAEMALQRVLSIAEAVRNKHRGRMTTHYDGCFMDHASCMAKVIFDSAGERWDPAREGPSVWDQI